MRHQPEVTAALAFLTRRSTARRRRVWSSETSALTARRHEIAVRGTSIARQAASMSGQPQVWNRNEPAEILGISYKALLYKIKESGLDKAS
jgi:hypothetical protein